MPAIEIKIFLKAFSDFNKKQTDLYVLFFFLFIKISDNSDKLLKYNHMLDFLVLMISHLSLKIDETYFLNIIIFFHRNLFLNFT